MRLAGCEGILFWCTVVLSLEAWLGSTVTAADLSRQRLSLYHWRWEPACTEEKKEWCYKTGMICNEPTGECTCLPPKKMDGDTCREPACTEEKKKECSKTGHTCKEPTGECTCEPPKVMYQDTCTACTEEKVEECAETGKTCHELTGECTCKFPKMMEGGICRACTEEKVEECAETGKTCNEHTGDCVCKAPKVLEGRICTACTRGIVDECTKTGQTCSLLTGDCVCEAPKIMSFGSCTEPACTEEKKEECSKYGHTCKEPTGECTCEPPKMMEGGMCTVCPIEKVEECTKTGKTCDEATGKCTCEPPKMMDGDTCRVCPIEKVVECTKTGKTCDEKTGGCVCEAPKMMEGDICRVCTEDKVKECEKTGTVCEELTGECTCLPPKVMDGAACRACPQAKVEECAITGQTCHELTGYCVCEAPREIENGTCRACTEEKVEECARTGQTCEELTGECTCKFPKKMDGGICIGTGECIEEACKPPRCLCASDAPPAGVKVEEMPQFVMLTFDGAVNAGNMPFYRELLNISNRKNKENGCGIAATFFTSAEYLDYEAVNQLHSWGNEIALKSISDRTESSYWQTINTTEWEREVLDQRAMLTAFANVPGSDVTGFRGPFLITGGDQGFRMLHRRFRYDSTLIHQRSRGERPFYPYTMDFGFRRSCNVFPCPEGSYPGLWVLPINVLFAKHTDGDLPCAMADACLPQPVTAEDTFGYFKSNFEEFYTTNRAPFPVFLHEAYLKHPERKAGYLRFVDWLLQKDDVYVVTASEVLRFMANPEPLSAYAMRPCTGQNVYGPNTCPRPTTCSYKNTPPGGERYMRTCSRCPKNYPWVNNPLGN